MQFQEFALDTIILIQRNFKNDTIKRRTFQHTGLSSCIKPCSEKLHQLIDIKDDEAELCSVWQLLQCVNSKFLVKKTFPQRQSGFYFLARKMFQSHRQGVILDCKTFLTVNIFQCFDLKHLRWLHPSAVTDISNHFLEHMSSYGSTQVQPF